MPSLAIIVEETQDIDGDTQLFLNCGDVFDGNWVWDVVQSKLLKEVDVVARSIGLLFKRHGIEC